MPVKKHGSSNQEDLNQSPATPQPRLVRRLVLITTFYALLLLVILVANALGPERWWLTGFNLYMPQWIWLTPLVLLIPLSLWRARRMVWMALLLLAVVLGPVMGLSWHFYRLPAAAEKGVRLRVMTYNIKWAKRDVRAIEHDIQTNRPDILLMQDAGAGTLSREMGLFLKGWNLIAIDQYIVASHLPLTEGDVRWISYPQHNHRVLRCLLHVQGRTIVVYCCHLESPRYGLAAMRHPRAGLALLEANLDFRVKESQRLAEHVRSEKLPVLLAGDLNAPVQSLVCQNLFAAGLQDAFSRAGSGFGYTYGATTRVGLPYIRIDHIMTDPEWQTTRCWVGNDAGSDHCPVIADLFLPEAK